MALLAKAVIAVLLGVAITSLLWWRRASELPDLDELRKDELYERAREAGIQGRSQMTKAELRTALRAS